MRHPSLASLWHFPGWVAAETYFYLMFVGGVTTVLVGGLWLCAWVLHRMRVPRVYQVARGGTLWAIAAYLCGAPANLLFIAVFRYHAYVPGDPIVDWLPFIPTGAWVVDPNFGGRFINGGSPEQLRKAWAALALPVWLVALWLSVRLTGRIKARPSRPHGAHDNRRAGV
jgi:hypothetical protein